MTLLEIPCPFLTEFGTLKLLEPLQTDPKAIVAKLKKGTYDKPFIVDNGTERILYFSLALIQSAMRLDDPYALNLAYTRKMMSFLLFQSMVRSVLLLGLGGGSLAKYCYRHLPTTGITVVEANSDVIALRDQFFIPPDDARFQVVLADAADYVISSEKQFDTLLMDVFDRAGLAGSVSTQTFYEAVWNCLTPRGVLVVNLAGGKQDRKYHLGLMEEVFGRVLVLPVEKDENHIAFAFRDASFEPRWKWIGQQAKTMKARYGLDFPRFVNKLEQGCKRRGVLSF